ncbi:MAG: hypothetical protein NZ781_08520 [Armatimonadetes bacterium]|nr:hypothetical protein [Armatimonadota bacterium]
MGFKGTVKGRIIELDEPIPLPDGTRVEVTVKPEGLRKGSPQLILQTLVGTLTDEEAEAIMKVVREEVRRIDWELWEGKGT